MNRSLKIASKEKFGILLASTSFIVILTMILGTLAIIVTNSLGVFWQSPFQLWVLKSGEKYLGELKQSEETPDGLRIQIRVGNRDIYGQEFLWLNASDIATVEQPKDAVVVERQDAGFLFGFFGDASQAAFNPQKMAEVLQEYQSLKHARASLQEESNTQNAQIQTLNEQLATLKNPDPTSPEVQKLTNQISQLNQTINALEQKLDLNGQAVEALVLPFHLVDGKEINLQAGNIVHYNYPNQMSLMDKSWAYATRLWSWLSSNPREANTEGGVYPAIIGTILMVFLMSILSFPLGVITAIYLSEYAKDGWMLRLVRVAVNNLAGVPSIIYGIFGLGFFIYGVGSWIDQFFFPERLPNPTFGTGGILWASLTLGLLTAPVVIVATEEALISIPSGIREASLALGANKFQTIWKVVMPMTIPGMMTGFILAMARAAGEVAPLMITGVVKLAPSLPIDGEFPYVHFERKFMHLGFHIFDLGFQSPNIEASRPMVFMTTLLLMVLVVCLSLYAMILREKMRARYFKSSI